MCKPKKLPAKTEKNYRIRFRDERQLALIKKAASQHGFSFNSFVIDSLERIATVLVNTPRRDIREILSNAAVEAFSSKE